LRILGCERVLPALLAQLDAIRQIAVPDSEGYGIWAPGGNGPGSKLPQPLVAINQETTRIPGWRSNATRPGERAALTGPTPGSGRWWPGCPANATSFKAIC